MERKTAHEFDQDLLVLFDAYVHGAIDRRGFLDKAAKYAVGGTLALVRDGDMIALDVEARRLHLDVSDEELARRRSAWTPPPLPTGGYVQLYVDHVGQADTGADFDFLVGCRGHAIARESH